MRIAFAAGLLMAALTFACGGDDAPEDPTATTAPAATGTVAPTGDPAVTETATSTPVPTPTPVPEGGPAAGIFGGGQALTPTVAEFRALPQESVTLPNGEEQSGTTIAELAAQLGLSEPRLVTMEGLSDDFVSVGFVRFPYADIASDTVLFVTPNGHVAMVSLSIPESQWLDAVVSVAFE